MRARLPFLRPKSCYSKLEVLLLVRSLPKIVEVCFAIACCCSWWSKLLSDNFRWVWGEELTAWCRSNSNEEQLRPPAGDSFEPSISFLPQFLNSSSGERGSAKFNKWHFRQLSEELNSALSKLSCITPNGFFFTFSALLKRFFIVLLSNGCFPPLAVCMIRFWSCRSL